MRGATFETGLKDLSSLATVTGVVNAGRKALLDCWSKGTPISFIYICIYITIYVSIHVYIYIYIYI
jgi:hypothetical protein